MIASVQSQGLIALTLLQNTGNSGSAAPVASVAPMQSVSVVPSNSSTQAQAAASKLALDKAGQNEPSPFPYCQPLGFDFSFDDVWAPPPIGEGGRVLSEAEAKEEIARYNALSKRTGFPELNEEFAASLMKSYMTVGI